MKIIEKVINEDTGGHCLLSCITIEQGDKLHFFFNSSIETYIYAVANKNTINKLKESNEILEKFDIEGEYRYIDIFVYLYSKDIFNEIETSIFEDDNSNVEDFLISKIQSNLY
ncbi:hypothetical protein QEW_4436 [Clostridioides difficile CD160]|nr:hypothetical protein QEW_4436 [Clostridioides difficile CD160]